MCYINSLKKTHICEFCNLGQRKNGLVIYTKHKFVLKVLVHVVGALAECAKLPHNAAAIHRAGGLKPLVELLNLTNQELLANTAHVLGECAWDLQCMEEMERHDAVRLIWSLLKKNSTDIQAHAAWALVPCIKNATVMYTDYCLVSYLKVCGIRGLDSHA